MPKKAQMSAIHRKLPFIQCAILSQYLEYKNYLHVQCAVVK